MEIELEANRNGKISPETHEGNNDKNQNTESQRILDHNDEVQEKSDEAQESSQHSEEVEDSAKCSSITKNNSISQIKKEVLAIEKQNAWKLHAWMDENPLLSFCSFLGAFIVTVIIAGVLATTGNLINFTTEVPFHMRSDLRTQNYDSLIAGEDDAKFEISSSDELGQGSQSDITLTIIYKAKKNNLMKPKILGFMQNIEESIWDTSSYENYCQLVYNSSGIAQGCNRYSSLVHFFDQDYFVGAINQSYDVYPSISNFDNYLSVSKVIDGTATTTPDLSQSNIDAITEFWAGYGRGTKSSKYSQGTYNGQQMPATFYYSSITSNGYENSSLANFFKFLADNSFGTTPTTSTVKAALTSFSFGLPLEGYESASFELKDQEDDISKWCFEEFHDKLVKWREKYSSKFDIVWSCGEMDSYYMDEIIGNDLAFLFGTIVTVWAYMVFAMNSFWLANMGMLMIFLSFAPSVLLYRYIAQIEYFGTLNMLCLFIILSIGADNIFVLHDTWAQIRQEAPHVNRGQRLTFGLKHAATVMATTSLSTIVSFLGNTSSVFPAIYAFGAFAAFVVFVNYCADILFFPAALVLHDEYFYTPNLKYSCCISKKMYESKVSICSCCWNSKNQKTDEEIRKENEEKRPVDKFFEEKYFKRFLYPYRKLILVVFFIIFLIFFFFATQLSPDPNPPQILPDNDPYEQYRGVITNNFASDSSFQITNYVVFGLKGIDRKGTDETLPDDIGKPKYSGNMSFLLPNEQLWLAQFCDDLLCQYNDYDCRYLDDMKNLKVTDPDVVGHELEVRKCFMSEFREWVLTDPDASPNATQIETIFNEKNLTECGYDISNFSSCTFGTFPIINSSCATFLFAFVWLDDTLPTTNPDYQASTINYDYWKPFIYAHETESSASCLDVDIAFFEIGVLLDAYITTFFEDGIQLWKDWDKYIKKWKTNENGEISQDRYGNEFVSIPSRYKDVFFTDKSNGFPYYYLQQQIINECITGIGISLILALFILVVATNNWILALMSTFVILQIVVCVMGFAVMLGWKLGAIESIIFIMVVGMAVDYVVHLSQSYLSAMAYRRKKRTRKMLGRIGGSIISGFASTFLGVIFLTPAYILFFVKFGISIAFLEVCSVSFGLIGFAAAVASFGPEYDVGNVKKDCGVLKSCCVNLCSPTDELKDQEDEDSLEA